MCILCSRELSTVGLKMTSSEDYTSSLVALSKLKNLEKFIIAITTKEDSFPSSAEKATAEAFVYRCLQAMPSVKYLGYGVKKLDRVLSEFVIVHSLRSFEGRIRLGCEQLVLDRDIPKNCCLHILKSVFLKSPLVGSINRIAKLSSVTEIGILGECNERYTILSMMGNQLTSLNLHVPSINIAGIFKRCRRLAHVYITTEFLEEGTHEMDPFDMADDLMCLETFALTAAERCLKLPFLFIEHKMHAPRLTVLKLVGARPSMYEMKRIITDVRSGNILKNLQIFKFEPYGDNMDLSSEPGDDFFYNPDYDESVVSTFLECCVAYCPRIKEVTWNDKNILCKYFGTEQMRMENMLKCNRNNKM